MIDFDSIDDWETGLSCALRPCMPVSAEQAIRESTPEFVEDACDLLLDLAGRERVIDATLGWLRTSELAGYHGTRLCDAELESVVTHGLFPLRAGNRRDRLARALSRHPQWADVENVLDSTIRAHGEGNCAGHRENQVHLTLSKCGLTNGFNHYLTYGAEFDLRIAQALLDAEGEELLRQDGQARVIQFAIPGVVALEATHPHFTIDDIRRRGEVPNLVHDFLKAWSYRLAHPGFQCRTLKVDCGMVFRSAVSPEWIRAIDTLDY